MHQVDNGGREGGGESRSHYAKDMRDGPERDEWESGEEKEAHLWPWASNFSLEEDKWGERRLRVH